MRYLYYCSTDSSTKRNGPNLSTALSFLCAIPPSLKVAATGSTGSFDATTLGGHQRRPTASPSDTAQQMKEQATVLHRAGEYEEAAAEFARAAEVLEGSAGGQPPLPALSAIRLSLAAAQLKVTFVQLISDTTTVVA